MNGRMIEDTHTTISTTVLLTSVWVYSWLARPSVFRASLLHKKIFLQELYNFLWCMLPRRGPTVLQPPSAYRVMCSFTHVICTRDTACVSLLIRWFMTAASTGRLLVAFTAAKSRRKVTLNNSSTSSETTHFLRMFLLKNSAEFLKYCTIALFLFCNMC